jgi:hypothetical protein
LTTAMQPPDNRPGVRPRPPILPAPDVTTTFFHDDDGLHPEVSDALLGFVYDASTNAGGLDDLLHFPSRNAAAAYTTGPTEDEEQHCDKKLRAAACGQQKQQVPAESSSRAAAEEVVPPPQPRAFVRGGADEKNPGPGGGNTGQSAAAKARRKRISQKTAELSRLIPGGHRLSTADMLTEAARHVKLLQAQAGMLKLMRSASAGGSSSQNEEQTAPVVITAAQEEMQHALLASGRVQQRLAAEGRCLVPTSLVRALARDEAVTSDTLLSRDLGRFIASLPPERK